MHNTLTARVPGPGSTTAELSVRGDSVIGDGVTGLEVAWIYEVYLKPAVVLQRAKLFRP